MAASRPRTSPRRAPVRVTTSCVLPPSLLVSRTAPFVVAVSGSRPRMLRAVTVLPLPLSPTIASTSPGPTDRLTPLTAATVPASVAKLTDRLSMSTRSVVVRMASLIARLRPRSAPRSPALPAMLAHASLSRQSPRPLPFSRALEPGEPAGPPAQRPARHHRHVDRVGRRVAAPTARAQPGVGEVVEALADQSQSEHDQRDGEARPQRRPPDAAGDVRERLPEVVAPFGGLRRLDAEA